MKIFLSGKERTSILGGAGLRLGRIGPALAGGLDAQLLEDPDLEREDAAERDRPCGWTPCPEDGKTELRRCADRPLCASKPHYLRLTVAEGGAGVKNDAFGGVFLRAGERYHFSFALRSYEYKGKIKAGLYAGSAAVAEKTFSVKPDGAWHFFSFRFKSKKEITAEPALFLCGAGTVHLDDFSLLPENAVKGLFRRDLSEHIKRFKPAFLQFDIAAEDLSRLSRRSSEEGRRRARRKKNFPGGERTGGIGVYECFLFSEFLGAEPRPLFRAEELRDGEGGQNAALELIEFALGGKETAWGSLRARLGHGEPFPLKELFIEAEAGESFERLEGAIREKYPDLSLRLQGPAEEVGGGFDWQTVLKGAAALLEAEQRGEPCAGEPPLLLRTGSAASGRCLLGFDGRSVYETADFHVRAVFSHFTGIEAIKTFAEGGKLAASASERDGMIFLKIANLSEEPAETETEGDFDFGNMTRVLCLDGAPGDCNSLSEPEKIKPYEIAPRSGDKITLPPHSFSVLVFRK